MADNIEIGFKMPGLETITKNTEQLNNQLQKAKLVADKIGIDSSNVQTVKQLASSLDKMAQSASKLDNELKDVDNSLEDVKDSADEMNQELDKSGNISQKSFGRLRGALKDVSKSIAETGADALNFGDDLASNVSSVGDSIAGLASGFGLAGVAAGLAISALTPFVAELFEADEATKALEESTANIIGEYAEEKVALDDLFQPLFDNTLSTKERKDAIEALKKAYPDYLGGVNLEKASLTELTVIYNELNAAIIRGVIAKEKANRQTEIATKLINAQIASDKLEIQLANVRNKINAIPAKDQVSVRNLELSRQFSSLQGQLEAQSELIKQYNDELNTVGATYDAVGNKLVGFSRKFTSIADFFDFGTNEFNSKPTKLKKAPTKKEIKASLGVDDYGSALNEGVEDLKNATEKFDEEGKKLALSNIRNIQSLIRDEAVNQGKLGKDSAKNVDELVKDNIAQQNKIEEANKKLQASQSILFKNLSFVDIKTLFPLGEGGELVSLFESTTGKDIKLFDKEIRKAIENLQKSGDLNQFLQELSTNGISSKYVQALIDDKDNALKRIKENDSKKDAIQKAIEKDGGDAAKVLTESDKKINEILDKGVEDRKKLEAKTNREFRDLLVESNIADLILGDFDKEKITQELNLKKVQIAETISEANQLKLDAFNKLNQTNLKFEATSGNIAVTGLDAIFNSLVPEEQAKAFDLAEILNKQVDAQIKVLETDFYGKKVEEYLNVLRTGNRVFFKKAEIAFDASAQVTKIKKDDLAAIIKDSGKEVTETEVAEINRRKQDVLEALEEQKRREIALEITKNAELITLIEQQGGDVTDERAKLTIKLAEINRKYAVEAAGITPTATSEDTKKKTQETIKEIVDITKASQQLIGQVFEFAIQQNQAYLDLLNEQLSGIDEQISNTQGKISELEDDLEGKRSGRRDAVLQSIELEKQREIDLANQKIALEKKIAEEQRKIRIKEQAAAIAQALINGALSITAITTVPDFTFGIASAIRIGLVAASTAAQVATIASQKFAKGGILEGASHSQGGIQTPFGELEGGEAVINKNSTRMFAPLLSQINEAGGGKRFATGGILDTQSLNQNSNSASGKDVVGLASMNQMNQQLLALQNRPIYVRPTEVTNMAASTARMVQSVTI